jgi:uncharacterized membrane protein YozB (DUF420 family)
VIVLLTVAQVADLVTALNMAPGKVELNPVGAELLALPLAAVAAKAALLGLLASVVAIIRHRRPQLARLIVLAGINAGVVGALSNS